MSRFVPVLCALATLVSACSGGGDNANTQPAPPPPPDLRRRLAWFDSAGLGAGLEIPVFTDYWTLAEQRNGNAYPIKASVSDKHVLTVRLDAKGELALREGNQFVSSNLAALSSSLDTLAQAHWDKQSDTTTAAVILFVDARAPYRELLVLCRELVDLRVPNLWLVTADKRDETTRLLPLIVDTTQFGNEWYQLDETKLANTIRFTWVRNDRGQQVGFDWVANTSSDLGPRTKVTSDKWKATLAGRMKSFMERSHRIQFDLPQDARIAEFTEFANLFAPVGYAELEPFWPALERPEESDTAVEARKLADFTDSLESARDLNLPTLSHWWRASAADRGLRAAGELDKQRPLLAIRAAADGSLATRTWDEIEWTPQPDDMGVLQAMRRLAGEIDFDTGLSELQILLAMDRYAMWETFLGVLEMMKSVGCFRLFVVTNDLVGPTLRLLDLALPVGAPPGEHEVAAIVLTRPGTVAEAEYTAKMMLDGVEHTATGPRFSSSLMQWTGERKADPKMLGIKLPRDEPFETLFTVLNAVAWLGAPSVTFGG